MIGDLSLWLASIGPAPLAPGPISLTTAERVAEWMAPDQGVLTPSDDQLRMISRLVQAVSGMALSYMNRDTLLRTRRTETYPSSRTGRLVLRHWPVLSLGGASIGQSIIRGVSLEVFSGAAQRLVVGDEGTFVAGPSGIGVVYDTGFVRAEDVTTDDEGRAQASSMFLRSEGVAAQDGSLVAVESVSASGAYSFGAQLANTPVTLVYSYVPPDIEQVVIEECALAFRSRQRIGEQSKALPNGGGTSTYSPRALSTITREALNNYRRVVPS